MWREKLRVRDVAFWDESRKQEGDLCTMLETREANPRFFGFYGSIMVEQSSFLQCEPEIDDSRTNQHKGNLGVIGEEAA